MVGQLAEGLVELKAVMMVAAMVASLVDEKAEKMVEMKVVAKDET